MIIFDENKYLFNPKINEHFSDFIQENRIKPAHIAKKLEVSRTHLSLILNKRRQISDSLRIRLNDFLGTDF